MWPLWLSLIGATCAQYTSVPSAKGPKQFAMSSDASRVIFMGAGWGQQMRILTDHDWNNMVLVPAEHGQWSAAFGSSLDGFQRDIATSADGSKVCMVWDQGYVWLSSDGGVTWAKVDSLGKDNWNSVTVSADGSKIFICSVGTYPNAGRVVLGTDAGSTWNDLNPGDFRYYHCSMSADGQTMVLAPHGEELMISTDGGLTFSESAGAGRSSWTRIVLSSDGSKILAGRDRHASDNDGAISSDSGATWTYPTAVTDWTHAAMSEDGSKIYVIADTIWSSFDGGTTWQEDFDEGGWQDLATTSDGSVVLAIRSDATPWYKNWPTTTYSTTSSTMTNTTTGTTTSVTVTSVDATTTTVDATTMTVDATTTTVEATTTTEDPKTVVEVTLTLTVDDPADIIENATLTDAMIKGFADVTGIDVNLVTLRFEVARRLQARRLQVQLTAIFEVTLPSAAAAQETLEAVEAISVEETNSAITNAVVAQGFQGNIEVTGKEATTVEKLGAGSGAGGGAASLLVNLPLALLLLVPWC